jgi:hypothetical protein
MMNFNQNKPSSVVNGPGNDYNQFRGQASGRGMWLPLNLANPYGQQQQMPMQQPAPQMKMMQDPNMKNKLRSQYDRLSMQASDALYGGLLGYNPKPITSSSGNQFQPPDASGGFRFPFGLLRGDQ